MSISCTLCAFGMAIDVKISHINRDIIMDKGEKQPGIAVEKEVGNAINQLIMNVEEAGRLSGGKKKRPYVVLQTECITVELENGFMSGSVVNRDQYNEPTITIEDQAVGAESNYFDGENQSGWDY